MVQKINLLKSVTENLSQLSCSSELGVAGLLSIKMSSSKLSKGLGKIRKTFVPMLTLHLRVNMKKFFHPLNRKLSVRSYSLIKSLDN